MPRSTPWTGITDNKILTHQDLKQAADDGYFDQKQVITLDLNQAITKARTIQHFDIDESGLSNRQSNQLVLKVHAKRPCTQCVNYNVIVDQSDIDASDDKKVYVYYYPCGNTGGTMSYVAYSYSGTYLSDVCIQNCPSTEAYIQVLYDGGANYPNPLSKLVILPGQCTSTKDVPVSMSGCTNNGGYTNNFTYQITKPGTTKLTTYFELDNSYGNFNFKVTGTTASSFNELFVGNEVNSFGEIFTSTDENISKSLGFYSTRGNKQLNINVNSKNDSTFTPYTLYFECGCTSTVKCTTVVTGNTETYVTGVTINVLTGGTLTYNNSIGQVSITLPTGTKTLTECLILETLKSRPVPSTNPQQYTGPLVLSKPAVYTITSTGNTCNSEPPSGSTSDDVYITFEANQGFSATAYWLDCYGIKNTRFITVGESFTTCGKLNSGSGLPITYGSACTCNSNL